MKRFISNHHYAFRCYRRLGRRREGGCTVPTSRLLTTTTTRVLGGHGAQGRRRRQEEEEEPRSVPVERYCRFSSSSSSSSSSLSSSSPPSNTNKLTGVGVVGGGTAEEDAEFFDVIIVGGGVVGSSMANLLRKQTPNLKVALIDSRKEPPPPPSSYNDKKNEKGGGVDAGVQIPHPRSYALSPRSITTVLGSELFQNNKDDSDDGTADGDIPIGYYSSMQVWQDSSPASLTFTTKDLDPDPSKASPYLGGCCEDEALVGALWNKLASPSSSTLKTSMNNNVELICNESVETLENIGDITNDLVRIKLKNDSNRILTSSVLVGADGGNSMIRKHAGISRIGGDYNQQALTFTVELENNNNNNTSAMNGRAYQRFLSDGGPMALLPTYSSNHAVIVWSTTPDVIKKWKTNAPEIEQEFVNYLNDALQDGPQRIPPLLEGESTSAIETPNSMTSTVLSNLVYGAERVVDTVQYGLANMAQHPQPTFMVPPKIKSIVSSKFTFPLSCYQASTYVKGRVCLIGDAAHTVHPMAGQGLNLGLADVDMLVHSCLTKSYDSGMDLATFLHEYNTDRLQKVSISLGGIHALQRIFVNSATATTTAAAGGLPFPPPSLLKHANTFGMNFVQNIGPLRRKLAMAAAHGL